MKTLALNLKAYAESTGPAGLRLAHAAAAVAKSARVRIVLAPQSVDLAEFSRRLEGSGCDVFAQHVDAVEPGPFTGYLTLESIRAAGTQGTLLNHSEHRMSAPHLAFVSKKARKLGLETLVCARNAREGARIARLYSPTMVAVEPPELIGKGVSVSTSRPGLVRDSVRAIRRVNRRVQVLVGAGVSTAEDVRRCVELGADGVLLASAFVKAREPNAFLRELALALGVVGK